MKRVPGAQVAGGDWDGTLAFVNSLTGHASLGVACRKSAKGAPVRAACKGYETLQ